MSFARAKIWQSELQENVQNKQFCKISLVYVEIF